MRIFIGVITIIFGVFFVSLSIDSFGKIGNVILHLYGIVLCILSALVLSNKKTKDGKIHIRFLGIAIAMTFFGIAFILNPGSGARSFGFFTIIMGAVFYIIDYVERI
ncbi:MULTISPECIES: hypothetical protein [Bacillaceae]|uniref:hypothetical protein n=1 Tax=Bacillaceae TaxID=186817 RepID=UPI0006F4412E|nr:MULTISPECIES: hypothetical protein [Bacillaceae]MDF2065576.1 hypothetical protein [Bacillus sp. Cr_A10]